MNEHACSGARCPICLDALLLATVFEPREEDAAMGAALDRAAEGLALLAEADAESARAQAEGNGHFIQDPSRGWRE